jgi:hypothetical protein
MVAYNPLRSVIDPERYGDDKAHYPALELLFHLNMKGIQVGSVLGLAFIPVLKVVRKTPVSKSFGAYYPLLTAASGLFVGFAPIAMGLDEEGIDDRGYRLEQNEPQKKCDRYSLMGLIGGSSIGVVVRQPIASCGFVGVAAGLGFYLVDKHGVIGFVKSQIPGGAKPSDE